LRIAIVGTGIAGLAAAWGLRKAGFRAGHIDIRQVVFAKS
jgi:2-polyprenyl-6-methoxyphenol hydroxylase-like FAD-dependent oxidoreductase